MKLPPIAPVFKTHYVGATEHRSSRICVTAPSGKRRYFEHRCELGSVENHFAAAKNCLEQTADFWQIVSMSSADRGGFYFTTAPVQESPNR